MTAAELRTKTDDELKAQLLDLRRETFNLRIQTATGQLEKVARIRQVRKEIARVSTLLNERKLGLEKPAGKQKSEAKPAKKAAKKAADAKDEKAAKKPAAKKKAPAKKAAAKEEK